MSDYLSLIIEVKDTVKTENTSTKGLGIDLGIKDMAICSDGKVFQISKAIQEQNFYSIRTKLINKCKERNIELRLVDIFYPSSKTCSCCGSVKKDLKLNDRIYKCCNCGLEIDRDYNASINLEKAKIYKVIA